MYSFIFRITTARLEKSNYVTHKKNEKDEEQRREQNDVFTFCILVKIPVNLLSKKLTEITTKRW